MSLWPVLPGTVASRLLLAAALLATLLAARSQLSGANYTAASANPHAQVASAADWVAPTVTLTNPGATLRGTVKIAASAADAYGSGVASVRIQRSLAGAGNWTDVCTATVVPYSCNLDTTALANDYYDLRAVAIDNAGFSATDTVADLQVDNLAPSVTMVDPGSRLSGVVTLNAEASDADTGVATVTIQMAPSGSSAWTSVCTATAAPYSCPLNTNAVAEGSYDFRAVATDVAGNAKTSSTIQSRRVDNTVNSVSLEDPGAYLHGSVNLVANASSSAGVTAVTILRAQTGSPPGPKSAATRPRPTAAPSTRPRWPTAATTSKR